MTDRDFTQLTSAYADDELTPALRTEMSALVHSSPALRADVDAHLAVREALHRLLAADPVPDHLTELVLTKITAQRIETRRRVLRLFVTGSFAAAAVLVLATTLIGSDIWGRQRNSPAPALPQRVTAEDFASIYRKCTLSGTHDEFKVGSDTPVVAVEKLTRLKVLPRPDLVLPELKTHGLHFCGACRCFPSLSVAALHAKYAGATPDDSISFFATDRRVRLAGCADLPSSSDRKRCYQVASAGDGVTILKWDLRTSSFALCGRRTPDELVALAESIRVAYDRGGITTAVACLSLR